MKAFFSKIWAWVLAKKVLAGVIAGAVVLAITAAIVIPVSVSAAKKRQSPQEPGTQEPGTQEPGTQEPGEGAPAHTHAYDDFGFCTCGDHQEPANVVALRNGQYSQPEKLSGGTKKIFKIFATHSVIVSSHYGFADEFEYEYFDGTHVVNKKLSGLAEYITPPATGTFVYIRGTVQGEEAESKMSYLKTAYGAGTVHEYDEHGHCACGWTDTTSAIMNYLPRTVDVNPSNINLVKDTVYSFKVKLYKDHEYKVGSFTSYPEKAYVEYFNYTQGQWVTTQFDNKVYDNFRPMDSRFVAPLTADYFVHIKATQNFDTQQGRFITQEHIYTDYGLDIEDRNYKGSLLTVGSYSDPFSMAAGEVKYFKWTFTSGQVASATGFQISGDHMAAGANMVHVEGIWFESNENTDVYYRETIQETGGYGAHATTKPKAGTYYIRVVNGKNETVENITIKPNIYPAA